MYNNDNNMYDNNNISNTINNNAVPAKKPFNVGKSIAILLGTSFLVFMIGTIANMFLSRMSVSVEMKPMMSLFNNFVSIIRIIVPMFILIIGIPAVLIIGRKDKSNK